MATRGGASRGTGGANDPNLRSPTLVQEISVWAAARLRRIRWTHRGLFDPAGGLHYLVHVGEDITSQQAAETEQARLRSELWHQAHHDPLTGLPNHRSFDLYLDEALQKSRASGRPLAVLLFDLDGFKTINDACGHPIGDAILQAVASRLRARIRGTELLARTGGDEFGALLTDEAAERPSSMAERLLEALRPPFMVAERSLYVGASLGISCSPIDSLDGPTLVQQADLALYQAKAAGRGCYRFYTEELGIAASEHLNLEQALRKALGQGELTLVYQPQVTLRKGQIIGAEALVRWPKPERDWVTPNTLRSVAETAGLICPLTEWVLLTACAQAAAWRAADPPLERIAVNIASSQLQDGNFLEIIQEILAETSLPPEALELEVAETALGPEPSRTPETLVALQALGIGITLDDFGAGHWALSWLQGFPGDRIKLSQNFVANLPQSTSAAIIEALLALGRALEIAVLADGVETEDQRVQLLELGCTEGQGFLFGQPLPAEEFARQTVARDDYSKVGP